MTPVSIGTRIQVLANSNSHHYRIGSIHRVLQVDSDGSFRAIDDQGIEGDYLKWRDCQAVGLGWDWIRGHLDAHSLELLSAFDGLQNLRLRESVESKVITSSPTLAETILKLLPEVDEANELHSSATEGSNLDDFDDDAIQQLLADD